MTDPIFVDTNVLVYRFDAGQPEKQRRADAWLARLWRHRLGRLSFQVLREFYVTVTRKLPSPLEPETARRAVRTLHAWHPAADSHRIIDAAWSVEDRYSLSFWDALIIAAAHEQGCGFLLTEDLQDGQELAGVRVVNPFRHSPDDVLG